MSTGRSRIIRWFGTQVPLVSRGFLAVEALLVSLILSAIIYSVFGLSIISPTAWLLPLLFTLLFGIVSYFLLLILLNVRFQNYEYKPPFSEMIGRVHQRIQVSSRAKVWTRHSDKPYIVSTFNPVFDAVIVSEPMVDLMLNRPEAGEAVLAFHLARMPRKLWFGDFIGSLVLFVIVTYLSALLLAPLIALMISYGMLYGGMLVVSLASALAPYILLPLFIAMVIKGAFWQHESAFLHVSEVYGIHPQVAKVEVERGAPLNEEETQAVVWGVREWEKKRRSSRRIGISTIVAILVGGLLFIPVTSTMILDPYFPYYFYSTLIIAPFLIGAIIGIIVYMALRRWDKNAMAEVFHETTDSHEPIWMD